MKVSNWRRKLAASLVAGGLMAPQAVKAAPVNTNLLLNPGFENVNLSIVGDYNAPLILDWQSATQGFAYSHNGSTAGTPPLVVPDYANNGPLVGGGNWYFAANNANSGDGDIDTIAEALFQNIDVSTGASGALIAGGGAAFNLGAFFNTYLNDNDGGIVQVDFLSSSSVNLGTTMIRPPDPGNVQVWSQFLGNGPVPVGTATARVSLYAFANNSGADGYVDNVDFRIISGEGSLLFLEVDPTDGRTRLRNLTGAPVTIDYYEITSGIDGTGNSLNPTAWNGFQEQGTVPGFPAGNGSGNGWEAFGGADVGTIGESYLTGNSNVPNNANISLGNAYQPGDPQNLFFRYAVPTEGTGPASDRDDDGDVDGNDLLLIQRDPTSTAQTFTDFRNEFGTTGGGSPGPSVLVTGFVRFVDFVVAVPEPSSVIIAGLGLLAIGAASGRRIGA